MVRLAFRNLFQSRTRLLISVGGLALAFTLILALDAILVGTERQVAAYMTSSGADVFVSQSGVRNMHMTSSSLPVEVVERVRSVAGVDTATPILYLTNMIVVGGERSLAYVIGLPSIAAAGAPWSTPEGSSLPKGGQAVIDRGVARKSGAGLGDPVTILGRVFTISGLSEGTSSLVNTVAFISIEDFAALRGFDEAVSFVLVRVEAGYSPDAVARRIEDEVGSVTAQSSSVFADQERQVVRDMSTDIAAIMNLVGFLIGLAVMALTVYTATLSRRSEYGLLKAIGASGGNLYRAVLAQATISVGLGFGLGLVLTLALAAIVPMLGPGLSLVVSGGSLAKVLLVSLLIAGLSALLPIRQIAGLDPAMVFQGRMR